MRSGWAQAKTRPDAAKIREALEHEDNELRVRVQAVVDEAQDTEEILEEEKRVVSRRRDGGFLRNDYARLPSSGAARDAPQQARTVHRHNHSARPATAAPPVADDSPGMASHSSAGHTEKFSVDSDKKPSPVNKTLFPSSASTTGSLASRRSAVSGPIVLCSESSGETSERGQRPVRTVTVSSKLSQHLKIHQAEGVHFMWKNCFSDFAYEQEGDADLVGGCILAHCMGTLNRPCAQVVEN